MTASTLEGSNDFLEQPRYRSLFISDVHLGTKGAQVEALLEFLRHHDAGIIYLVGDIVDGWRMRRARPRSAHFAHRHRPEAHHRRGFWHLLSPA
jgi:UDP-2,3-diacylglucosamine pyrophosphatase LpxH